MEKKNKFRTVTPDDVRTGKSIFLITTNHDVLSLEKVNITSTVKDDRAGFEDGSYFLHVKGTSSKNREVEATLFYCGTSKFFEYFVSYVVFKGDEQGLKEACEWGGDYLFHMDCRISEMMDRQEKKRKSWLADRDELLDNILYKNNENDGSESNS